MQAYYAKERVRLFALLVMMLHEQNHYSWATATREGFHLARAAATFGDARANYEIVLPDLENAYGIAKNWLHAGFDPPDVARAELAWWVARRTPGEGSPERVGGLMADAYALLYEAPRSRVTTAPSSGHKRRHYEMPKRSGRIGKRSGSCCGSLIAISMWRSRTAVLTTICLKASLWIPCS